MVLRSLMLMALVSIALGPAGAEEWAKWEAAGAAYSLHYPAGWKVTVEESSVRFSRAATREELELAALPPELGETPRAVAEALVRMLREEELPDLEVRQWRGGGEAAVMLLATYTEEGRRFSAEAIVVKEGETAVWVAYSVPQADYAEARSHALLQGLAGSLAAGGASERPAAEIPALATEQAERNGRAFVFVLEFAMGAPFSAAQERLVLDAFKESLAPLSAEERAQFDAYPALVEQIKRVSGEGMEALRDELRRTIREEVQGAGEDPVLQMLGAQLDKSNEVVAAGEPPLLRVAAQAMGEMLAYGRLLEKEPQAGPEEYDPKLAAKLRDETIAAWGRVDEPTRQLATNAPGIWMVIRTVLRTGEGEGQAELREQLRSLAATQREATERAAAPAAGGATGGAGVASQMMGNWVTQNTLAMMRQQTFNTYMWSRGYAGWTPMGKMW